MNMIVGSAFCGVVLIGAVLFTRAKAWYDFVADRPDSACVAQSAADNERLSTAITPYLPPGTAAGLSGAHGCGPPKSGAWIGTDLPGITIKDALRGFRAPAWTPVSASEAQEYAEDDEVAIAVTGDVDGRKADVYATQPKSGVGPVTITAWFDE
ncbi:hypothetical protein [Sphaerisporangium corydalis]|uniref:Secreted protein n=1 Tax=Sphaerisporangium corydalis TaxID=1441875 RepID=A0ABV9EMG7_9ACTN|nr:hypothetical protein [Sphaerisporangium corydalis]